MERKRKRKKKEGYWKAERKRNFGENEWNRERKWHLKIRCGEKEADRETEKGRKEKRETRKKNRR